MRAIIQRVSKASVTVDGSIVSSIGNGLCVLLGICKQDSFKDAEYIAKKILNLRLFDDHKGKRWAKSVSNEELEILCVSQFTLHAVLKGNKPDFHQSMSGDQSKILFDETIQLLRQGYKDDHIKTGVFGATMEVDILNSGPVTITIESNKEGNDLQKETDGLTKSKKEGNHLQKETDGSEQSVKPFLTEDIDVKLKNNKASQASNLFLKKTNLEVEDQPFSRIERWLPHLQTCANLLGYKQIENPFQCVLATLKSFVVDAKLLGTSLEDKALVNNWLFYGIDSFEALVLSSNLIAAAAILKETDSHLASRVFLVAHSFTLADLFLYVLLRPSMASMSFHDKQQYLNLTRWFSHLQSSLRDDNLFFQRSLIY